DVVEPKARERLLQHTRLLGAQVPARAIFERGESVDRGARRLEIHLDLAGDRVLELAERDHGALREPEDELKEERRVARLAHDPPPGPLAAASAFASSHSRSISSRLAWEGVRPLSASRFSMWWNRSRNRCVATRSSRSGSTRRWRARFTTANSRSPISCASAG